LGKSRFDYNLFNVVAVSMKNLILSKNSVTSKCHEYTHPNLKHRCLAAKITKKQGNFQTNHTAVNVFIREFCTM